jgi:hypothetical protein
VSSSSEERLFTPEEADSLVPSLTESLIKIQEARQQVLSNGERIRRTARHNGGGTEGSEYWHALATLREEVERITGLGIVLRDPESGLLDFPALRDGRQVFLCWRMGEQRVEFWHSPESGFGGRQPL